MLCNCFIKIAAFFNFNISQLFIILFPFSPISNCFIILDAQSWARKEAIARKIAVENGEELVYGKFYHASSAAVASVGAIQYAPALPTEEEEE
jgi:hypothetical protein